ncbi:hypothetical protein Lal_00045626 [Lupinus albus]|nr:hypothetical protein Lal_00045626 [Lupinus albus]
MVAEREMLGRFIEHWYVMVWFIVVMMWIAITHYVEEKPNNSNNHNHDRTIRRLRAQKKERKKYQQRETDDVEVALICG